MRAISGVRPISSGSITFAGGDISTLRADLRVVRGISQAPEGRGIFPGMTVLENLDMGAYSRRDRKELPRLLLLDEPSMGLAPQFIAQIFRIITEINQQQGVTVLLVEQNAQQALSRADRAYVIETGRITRTGTGRELLADPSIKKAYLGVA